MLALSWAAIRRDGRLQNLRRPLGAGKWLVHRVVTAARLSIRPLSREQIASSCVRLLGCRQSSKMVRTWPPPALRILVGEQPDHRLDVR